MNDIFKTKKRFLVDYQLNGHQNGLLVMAYSADDAVRRFEKMVRHQVEGLYPYPTWSVSGVRRVHKKIQI